MRLEDVILRGNRASQPAAAASNAGMLYCVTDEGNIVERSNGAAWQAFSPAVFALADDSVTNLKLANMAATTVKGNATAGAADPSDIAATASGQVLRRRGTALEFAADNATGADASGRPGSPAAGDLYLPNNGIHLERYSGAAWVPWGPLWPMTRPVDGDFAWINQGGASVSQTNGGIYLEAPANAGINNRIRKKAAPATPYTITAAIIINWKVVNTQTQLGGLIFREAATGAIHSFLFGRTAAGIGLKSSKYTDHVTFSAHYVDGVDFNAGEQPWGVLWFRIADDGVNRICSFSFDGYHFIQIHTIGRTDFLTADEVGFMLAEQSGVNAIGMNLLSWTQA